ncbi:response regulator receiver protein [Thermobaculum terrenum ATCC BAA-798]|uniref:Response regulator receiver protein n=1 Tax=Thermobaculum terrenum (strain ATCC BAA-798 / CCMEE 7001 / YNP1) TaxID=525904 RepID=D1CDT9_THET1|nr:response regulator [Thermobaculum terrenum]ACZ41095.1 response regulator receiver protein [Thermobaculum terrenum ATCC BAA-798]
MLMKKVLIVDDEAEIVELIVMVLDDGQVQLLTAYDGEQAMRIIKEQRPDVVLTDVMMPRLDGRELCKMVKSDPSISDTKVILMSAIHRLDKGDCPADGLIHKPFDIVAIVEAVHKFLDQ